MSILLKSAILEERKKGNIIIDPFDKKQLNPNSYNVRLSDTFTVLDFVRNDNGEIWDVKNTNEYYEDWISDENGILLLPNKLYLFSTVEYTETHGNLVPMLEGRSSLARMGLSIHMTAGFGDVGFCGNWTLELSVIFPLRIYAGMEIGQLYWLRGEGKAKEYNGKYQNARGIGISKIYEEFTKED